MDSNENQEAAKAGDTVFDFRGNLADKSRTGGWVAASLILCSELAERVCVIGISMNLVTYLVGNLHLSTSRSANVVTNFLGTLNLLPLLGGFLADAKFGRYLTVVISATVAAAGTCMLTTATSLRSLRPPECYSVRQEGHDCIEASGGQLALLYASLYTIAAGSGGVKANVSGFGSDQFDGNNPKEEKAMVFFFNWFYFGISLGSLFAVTFLVYIQDYVGRGWGYGISMAIWMVALAVLFGGTARYRFRRPKGSPITVVWQVLWGAWRKRRMAYPERATELNGYDSATVPHTDRFRLLDRAAILEESYSTSAPSETRSCCKSQPHTSTVTEVEEVKMVLNLLPIWATCILFWTVYSQMTTFSVEQATYMNRKIGSFTYPSGSLSFFLFVAILLITSLNEKLLVPLARRLTRNAGGITCLQRIGVGLAFSILAMTVSAVVEKKRRDLNKENVILSVFWLVPQFFLVGTGEGFVYVGQLEFFIREAPERMKSMSTGLFLSSISMGFFLSSVLVTLVDQATNGGWIKNDLNMGRLEYFYAMLAVLGVVNIVVFIVFARRHRYKVHKYELKSHQHGDRIWNVDNTEEAV